MSKRKPEKASVSFEANEAPEKPVSDEIKPKAKKSKPAMHGFGAALAAMTSLPVAAPAAAAPAVAESAVRAQSKGKSSDKLSAKLQKRISNPKREQKEGAAAATAAAALLAAKERQREQRRRRQKKELLSKDHQSAQHSELERRLIRVATKGVVTLFNVVAQQQKEAEAALAAAENAGTHEQSRRSAHAAQEGFVEKLRASSASAARPADAAVAAAAAEEMDAGKAASDSEDAQSARKSKGKKDRGVAWKALDEDYMMGEDRMRAWEASDSSDTESD